MSNEFVYNFEAFAWYWRHWSIHRDERLGDENADEYLKELIGTGKGWSSDKNRFLDYYDRTPEKVRDKLRTPEIQQALIGKFGLPLNFFEIESLEKLVDALPERRLFGDPAENHPQLLEFISGKYEQTDTHLCLFEERTLDNLKESLLAPQAVIVEWVMPFASGASWIAKQLHQLQEIRQNYTAVFHVTVDHVTQHSDHHLSEVYRRLGLARHEVLQPKRIADRIRRENVLIVFHRYEYSEEGDEDTLGEVFQTLKDGHVRSRCASVLLISSPRQKMEPNYGVSHPSLGDTLKVPPAERFPLFHEQFRRFQRLRGSDANPYGGHSRLKRARAHYNDDSRSVPIYPAAIKLRALFSSNAKNPSYYDPTLGFKRLADLGDLEACPDIKSVYDDTEAFLDWLSKGESGRYIQDLQLVRLISTSLYWLNTNSIERFEKKLQWAGISKFLSTAFRDDSKTYTVVAKRPDPDSTENDRLVMSMGTKAIVQDHWMRTDAKWRRYAHRVLADHLFFERTGVELGHEYPMLARHNDKDVLFLSEVIRHLVRSLEAFDKKTKSIVPGFDGKVTVPGVIEGRKASEWKWTPGWLLGEDVLPEPHPDQVIWRVCYTYLYSKLLMNGRERRLTHHHGAYALRLEILALVGGATINEVHPAMPFDKRAEYLADLGFTLLDVGRLQESLDAFRAVHETHVKNGDETAKLVRSSLDLAVVYGQHEQPDIARRWLEEANSKLGNVKEGEATLRNRYQARLAHIIYLEGKKPQEAADIFRSLEIFDLRPTITGERAHSYIAALGQFRKMCDSQESGFIENEGGWTRENALAKAMEICNSNLFSCAFAKKNHEALGFAISLAHLNREQGLIDAAEAILDQVYLDILQYGCSERTYLEFLKEAGRVLWKKGNPTRAYAAYLAPCIARAAAGGLTRTAKTSAKVAIQILEKLSTECEATSKEKWDAFIAKQVQVPKFLEQADMPRRKVGEPGRDPHFSYDLHDITEWVELLGSKRQIDEEVMRLRIFAHAGVDDS